MASLAEQLDAAMHSMSSQLVAATVSETRQIAALPAGAPSAPPDMSHVTMPLLHLDFLFPLLPAAQTDPWWLKDKKTDSLF